MHPTPHPAVLYTDTMLSGENPGFNELHSFPLDTPGSYSKSFLDGKRCVQISDIYVIARVCVTIYVPSRIMRDVSRVNMSGLYSDET